MSKFDYSILINKINEHNKIIVLTHKGPDYDAMGSQLALYLSLKATYPDKNILIGGEWKDDDYSHYYTQLNEKDYKGALAIFTDTPDSALAGDMNYIYADYVIAIDHHKSRSDFGDMRYVDDTVISACLLVYDIIKAYNWVMNQDIAYLLLLGLASDSGGFRYKNTDEETFIIASKLLSEGGNIHDVFTRISRHSLAFTRYKGYVMSNFKVYNNRIGYMVNTKALIEESTLSTFEIARGMISAMADIDGIDVWVNVTFKDDEIYIGFRSKNIPVVSVAQQYGGGGHELACGATLKKLEDLEGCLATLDQVIEDYTNNTEVLV